PVRGVKWDVSNLIGMLRSERMLGYEVRADGSRVTDGVGLPVRRAEPLITEAKFRELQAELDRRRKPLGMVRRNAAMLRHIAFCRCGQPMYQIRVQSRRYYRCRTWAHPPRCGSRYVPADW